MERLGAAHIQSELYAWDVCDEECITFDPFHERIIHQSLDGFLYIDTAASGSARNGMFINFFHGKFCKKILFCPDARYFLYWILPKNIGIVDSMHPKDVDVPINIRKNPKHNLEIIDVTWGPSYNKFSHALVLSTNGFDCFRWCSEANELIHISNASITQPLVYGILLRESNYVFLFSENQQDIQVYDYSSVAVPSAQGGRHSMLQRMDSISIRLLSKDTSLLTKSNVTAFVIGDKSVLAFVDPTKMILHIRLVRPFNMGLIGADIDLLAQVHPLVSSNSIISVVDGLIVIHRPMEKKCLVFALFTTHGTCHLKLINSLCSLYFVKKKQNTSNSTLYNSKWDIYGNGIIIDRENGKVYKTGIMPKYIIQSLRDKPSELTDILLQCQNGKELILQHLFDILNHSYHSNSFRDIIVTLNEQSSAHRFKKTQTKSNRAPDATDILHNVFAKCLSRELLVDPLMFDARFAKFNLSTGFSFNLTQEKRFVFSAPGSLPDPEAKSALDKREDEKPVALAEEEFMGKTEKGDTFSREEDKGDGVSREEGKGDALSREEGKGDTVSREEGKADAVPREEGKRDSVHREEEKGDTVSGEGGDAVSGEEEVRDSAYREEEEGDTVSREKEKGDVVSKEEKKGETVMEEKARTLEEDEDIEKADGIEENEPLSGDMEKQRGEEQGVYEQEEATKEMHGNIAPSERKEDATFHIREEEEEQSKMLEGTGKGKDGEKKREEYDTDLVKAVEKFTDKKVIDQLTPSNARSEADASQTRRSVITSVVPTESSPAVNYLAVPKFSVEPPMISTDFENLFPSYYFAYAFSGSTSPFIFKKKIPTIERLLELLLGLVGRELVCSGAMNMEMVVLLHLLDLSIIKGLSRVESILDGCLILMKESRERGLDEPLDLCCLLIDLLILLGRFDTLKSILSSLILPFSGPLIYKLKRWVTYFVLLLSFLQQGREQSQREGKMEEDRSGMKEEEEAARSEERKREIEGKLPSREFIDYLMMYVYEAAIRCRLYPLATSILCMSNKGREGVLMLRRTNNTTVSVVEILKAGLLYGEESLEGILYELRGWIRESVLHPTTVRRPNLEGMDDLPIDIWIQLGMKVSNN